jgi:hypothetical protein
VDKLYSIPDFLFSTTILGIGSHLLWFSYSPLWPDIGLKEQKAIAFIICIVAMAVLLSSPAKKGKRRSFSTLVKREAVRKQKAKCARCKRRLVDYSLDFDHKNGDRSNNKLSNCQALCTLCHRRKHI